MLALLTTEFHICSVTFSVSAGLMLKIKIIKKKQERRRFVQTFDCTSDSLGKSNLTI